MNYPLLTQLERMGGSHVVPVWFVLENINTKYEIEDIVFTTEDQSVKAINIK